MLKLNDIPKFDPEASTIPSFKQTVITRSKRALNDITNSARVAPNAEGKQSNKKQALNPEPVLISSHSIPDEQNASVVILPVPGVVPSNGIEYSALDRVSSTMSSPTRIYMRRSAVNIDEGDYNDPIFCSGYINDMYALFLSQENEYRVSASYMSNQASINPRMRCILIDWLVRLLIC